jgi:hypothetical protein
MGQSEAGICSPEMSVVAIRGIVYTVQCILYTIQHRLDSGYIRVYDTIQGIHTIHTYTTTTAHMNSLFWSPKTLMVG